MWYKVVPKRKQSAGTCFTRNSSTKLWCLRGIHNQSHIVNRSVLLVLSSICHIGIGIGKEEDDDSGRFEEDQSLNNKSTHRLSLLIRKIFFIYWLAVPSRGCRSITLIDINLINVMTFHYFITHTFWCMIYLFVSAIVLYGLYLLIYLGTAKLPYNNCPSVMERRVVGWWLPQENLEKECVIINKYI